MSVTAIGDKDSFLLYCLAHLTSAWFLFHPLWGEEKGRGEKKGKEYFLFKPVTIWIQVYK